MKPRVTLYVVFAALVVFVLGLYQLFSLRYERGDIYPEYSSLRADPLGTMALYEALSTLPGVDVQRDYSAENQLPRGRGITYLHLAASRLDWTSMDPQLLREIEGFVSAGGRLVIALSAEAGPWFAPGPTAPTAAPGQKKPAKSTPQAQQQQKRSSPETAWGFQFGNKPLGRTESGTSKKATVTREPDLPLPEELSWHSPIVFTNLAASWRTIYARKNDPVLIERALGLGTIVMATDCYFLSNEALLKDRQPGLLAWMVGHGQKVLFDEAHLGIVEESGLTILMHRYRLHAFGLALLVLAALFIWKNATSFPPAPEAPPDRGPLAGREAAAGFINLLRRNIAPAELLRICFDEWTKSLAQGRSCPLERIDAAQAVVERESARARTSRDPVRAYQEIAAVLKGGPQ